MQVYGVFMFTMAIVSSKGFDYGISFQVEDDDKHNEHISNELYKCFAVFFLYGQFFRYQLHSSSLTLDTSTRKEQKSIKHREYT